MKLPATSIGEACDEVNDDTAGAVVSRVIASDDVTAAAGPVLPAASSTAPVARIGWIVPSEQPDAVRSFIIPLDESGVNVQPVAVPAFEKSPLARPVTYSENTTVKRAVAAFVTAAPSAWSDDAPGAVVSMSIVFAPAMLLAPVGTVVDVIALPAVSATVPIEKLDTVNADAVSPACTVYVPDNVVPADAAVSVTVRAGVVLSVTVSVFPD